MATWKSAMRAVARAERAYARELAQREKQFAKQQAIAHAQAQVAAYDAYLETLVSLHRDCSRPPQWQRLHSAAEPKKAKFPANHTARATRALERYQPGFFARLFGNEKGQRARLRAAIATAQHKDKVASKSHDAKHAEAVRVWAERRDMADRVLRGDVEAYEAAITLHQPFKALDLANASLSFNFPSDTPDRAVVKVAIPTDEGVVPMESRSLTKTGKLSTRKLAKSKRFEVYQDFVCGYLLRLSRETFNLLPALRYLVLTAQTEMLDSSTVHMGLVPIASVIIPRHTLETLNFARLDASDSLANFDHQVSFKKTKGFAPCKELTLADIRQDMTQL